MCKLLTPRLYLLCLLTILIATKVLRIFSGHNIIKTNLINAQLISGRYLLFWKTDEWMNYGCWSSCILVLCDDMSSLPIWTWEERYFKYEWQSNVKDNTQKELKIEIESFICSIYM